MDCSTPGFPVHHQFLELTQTHVHRVGDAIQPSHPFLLSSPSPPVFNLPHHPGLFKWVIYLKQLQECAEGRIWLIYIWQKENRILHSKVWIPGQLRPKPQALCPKIQVLGLPRLLYFYARAAAAKSLQSCPTLCDPTDGSPPGSPVPGILQVRTLKWVAISFLLQCVKVKLLSCVRLFVIPWTSAYQAPPSMGFSRQEYWSGVPLPSPLCKGRSVLKLKVTHMSGIPLSLPLKTHF